MKIADLLTEFKEYAGRNCSLPVLTLTEKRGFVYQADRFEKRLALDDVSKYKVVRRGNLAFNPYLLWAGAVAHNSIVDAGVISPLYPTFSVNPEMDDKFVARRLLAPEMVAAYDSIAFGSVPRRRRSSVADFLDLDAGSVPPLAEQRRIAAILDQADAIRTKRRQTLAHLDGLSQSIFRDMFGNPDNAHEEVELGAVAELSGGRSLVASDEAGPSDYRVLKISAVTSGQFKWTESKALPVDYVPPKGHLVEVGDLLMSRANTAELVGATAFVDTVPANIALPDKVWKFDWLTESEPRYFHALLSDPVIRRRISELASGSGGSMKNVSKAKLLRMRIPHVRVSDQSRFVARADAIHLAAAVVKRALAADDELFASLQSRAFRGEL